MCLMLVMHENLNKWHWLKKKKERCFPSPGLQPHDCALIDCKFEDSTCDLESLTRCWGPHSFSTGTLFFWTGATPRCLRSLQTPPPLICLSRKSQKHPFFLGGGPIFCNLWVSSSPSRLDYKFFLSAQQSSGLTLNLKPLHISAGFSSLPCNK